MTVERINLISASVLAIVHLMIFGLNCEQKCDTVCQNYCDTASHVRFNKQ